MRKCPRRHTRSATLAVGSRPRSSAESAAATAREKKCSVWPSRAVSDQPSLSSMASRPRRSQHGRHRQ